MRALVLVSFLVFFSYLFANPVQIAKNLGAKNSEIYANFLDENQNSDIEKIVKTMQDSGELQLFLTKKTNITLKFSSNRGGILLIKAINNILEKNYEYQNLELINGSNPSYSLIVSSTKIPDPAEIYKALKKDKIYIKDITKSQNGFNYTIDMSKASLEATTFGAGYLKPTKPYFINVSSKSGVSISSQSGDEWRPEVRIYDESFKLLADESLDEVRTTLSIDLPQNAFYIQVGDRASLENIQKGLKIELK